MSNEWKVGQDVVIVEARHNGEIKTEDSVITKVGRKWVTVGEGWQEQRFDFDGMSDRDWGYRPRMWSSRKAFEAEQDRRASWRELTSHTKSHYPPKNLSAEAMRAIIEVFDQGHAPMTQTPTDALRLVPCPFCGGDVINTISQEMTKGPAYYWHKCETCGAESEGDYGEDVAVAAWNRRAAPASPLPGGGQFSGISGELDPRLVEWGYTSMNEAITHLGKLLDDQTAFDGLAAPTGDAK